MKPYNKKAGFTLIEIMIVIFLVGLLSAMAIPAFKKSRIKTQNASLSNDMRVFGGLLHTFCIENGNYPEDSAPGQLPVGLEEYITTAQWTTRPAIGGSWDVAKDLSGVVCAIGVSDYVVDEEQIALFDKNFDDGDLSTGVYRKLSGTGYYQVISE